MEKMTKRDYFNQLLTISAVAEDEALVGFVKHELELLDKKNASRKAEATETQKLNAALGEQVLAYIAGLGDVAATNQMVRDHFGLSPQKASPILSNLEKAGKLTVETVKRVKYYKAA